MDIRKILKQLDGAFAKNTLRAYRSDFNDFNTWCNSQQLTPDNITSEGIAKYIVWMTSGCSSATVRRRIASLSSLYKLMDMHDPTRAAAVVIALRRMHRQQGRAQKQALPLTSDILEQLLAVCANDLVGLRNRVLLHLGHETMRRRSELCRFCFEDLQTLATGQIVLNLRFSKTDQYGEGRLIAITPMLADLIQQWGETIGCKGYILRSVHKGKLSVGGSLTPASINQILVKLQNQAGLKLERNLSGHSFRVGAAVDMLLAGETMERIMLKGGWKSESTVMRYLRAMVL
jgi:site-specific recombinase XerD